MASTPSKPSKATPSGKPQPDGAKPSGPRPSASRLNQPLSRVKTPAASSPPPATGRKAPAPNLEPQPAPLDRTLRLLTRFRRFAWDIAGVALLALALMTVVGMAFPQLSSGLLRWWSDLLLDWFGLWGSGMLAPVIAILGLALLRLQRGDPPKAPWGRIVALEIAGFAVLALLSALHGFSLPRAEAGLDGGRVGWGLAELLRVLLSPLGPLRTFVIVLLLGLVVLLALLAGMGLMAPLARWAAGQGSRSQPSSSTVPEELAGPVVSEIPLAGSEASLAPSAKKKATPLPPQFRKNFRVQPEGGSSAGPPPPRDDRLPGLDLLVNEQSSKPDERNINLTAGLIEKTLAEFGIPAKVVGFRVGPTVTQFAVEPGFLEKEKPGSEGDIARQKIRVAQISALQRDLTLALSAERLRIEAPVPGRPYVGIEVPNSRSTVVRLRPILETEPFYKVGSSLAIALGRDVSGQPVVADLARMPHLLVAGTTGSGKSVCIAALTACLVMNNTPEDLRLVMIDPKMVELVRFNGLPHLMGKVETELERILGVLRWTVAEMDRRYKLLEVTHSRNLDSYNRKVRRRSHQEALPRLVVMIDELADLMMSAPDQTEHNIVRLAQMARAVGIHLVVATQRPSTDVVTGLIKANFPARISFAVASSVDSRVILDTVGAESLLGRGDMLFLPPEASGPIRAQGVMITDQEVERLISFWQKAIPPAEEPAISPWEEMMENEAVLADRDGLIEKAITLVREEQRASASLLQRRLKVGYPRAAHLMDELEQLGVIGPSQGGGRERDVLIGPDDDSPQDPDN